MRQCPKDHLHTGRDFLRCFPFIVTHLNLTPACFKQFPAQSNNFIRVPSGQKSLQPIFNLGVIRDETLTFPVVCPTRFRAYFQYLLPQPFNHFLDITP